MLHKDVSHDSGGIVIERQLFRACGSLATLSKYEDFLNFFDNDYKK